MQWGRLSPGDIVMAGATTVEKLGSVSIAMGG